MTSSTAASPPPAATSATTSSSAGEAPTPSTTTSHRSCPRHPSPLTFLVSTDVSTPIASHVSNLSGFWSQVGDTFQTTAYSSPSLSILKFSPGQSNYVDYQATVTVRGVAGLVFDYKSPYDYKFASLVAGNLQTAGQVIIGQVSGSTVSTLASVPAAIRSGASLRMGLVMSGSTVTVYLNQTVLLSRSFSPSIRSNPVGIMAQNGQNQFSQLVLRGDNPQATLLQLRPEPARRLRAPVQRAARLRS